MNTTNVFVELLVIGLGPVTALVLVALLVLGPSTLPITDVIEAGSSLAFLVPMLAATYVLGIVIDRLADWVFGLSASGRIRRKYFPTDQAYHDSRRTIMIHAPPIDRLRQYGRSRMRICRGWAVNAALIAVPANAYAAQHVASPGSTLLLIDVILGVTFLGTLLSWRTLTHSEYRKIRGGAAFLRSELGLPPLAGVEPEPLPAVAPPSPPQAPS